jgi:mannose/fructose/N-acetylgalactosamine-specific phosphotransferase system component IID
VTSLLVRVFMRSFLIQSCWNYEGMQNVGFAFGMAPVIEAVSRNKKERAGLLTDHLGYFNSHPYFASAIIGAAASAQLRRGTQAKEEIREIKDTLSNPFAALGDSLFWSTFKPLFSITAIITALLGSVLAPVVFLVLYNAAHLWVRGTGFVYGVRGRMDLMRYIKRMEIPNLTIRLRRITPVLLGLLAAGLAFFLPFPMASGASEWPRIAPVAVVLLVALLVRKGVGILTQIYGFSLIVLLLCWLL